MLVILWSMRCLTQIVLFYTILLCCSTHFKLQEAKCGFVVILMALYWCTECVPLAVTSLLPAILFPMMGIMRSEQVGTLRTQLRKVQIHMELSSWSSLLTPSAGSPALFW